jgi:stage IV sporulation protein FB
MHQPEPPPMRWELRGRLLGASFRIRLLFWASCVLPGIIYYQDPDVQKDLGGFVAFLLWLAAVWTSLLVHEAGHILAGRLLGAPVRVVLSGLGDQLFGPEEVSRWRRLLIYLAGPLVNALLYGVFWLVTELPLPAWVTERWRVMIGNGVWLLLWINAFWTLLNLLPLWPLDGGKIAVEVGDAVFGRRGQILALLLSLVVTIGLTVYAMVWMRLVLINRFDPRYPIYLFYFCILALYCYALWLSTFRALWGPDDESTELARR